MSGIFSLTLTFAATYSTFFSGSGGPEHLKTYLWIVAGISFAFANFKAWHGEHKARLLAEMQLFDRRPRFQFVITEASWRYEENDNKTLFFLMAVIINQGQDSIAVGWAADFNVGATRQTMVPLWLINPYVLQVGTTVTTLTNADLLPAKTRDRPVVRGSLAEGRLLFTLDGDRRSLADGRNFRINVKFYDSNGMEYCSEYTPSLELLADLLYPYTHNVSKVMQPELTAKVAILEPFRG